VQITRVAWELPFDGGSSAASSVLEVARDAAAEQRQLHTARPCVKRALADAWNERAWLLMKCSSSTLICGMGAMKICRGTR
jgi:hypothetical protein